MRIIVVTRVHISTVIICDRFLIELYYMSMLFTNKQIVSEINTCVDRLNINY